MALKAMEAEGIKVELNRAWIKLEEVDSSAIKVERCISSLREEVHWASLAQFKLEERVSELVKDTRVTSKKAIEEYKKSKAFKDEVIEGTLDIFLFGFDECKKQIRFLHPDLGLGKL